jgi:hypothetical protein
MQNRSKTPWLDDDAFVRAKPEAAGVEFIVGK